MSNSGIHNLYKILKLPNINFYILFVFLSFLKYTFTQYGTPQLVYDSNFEEKDINDKECFNNILRFNQRNYLLNNIGLNKNGDFLIQYNEYIDYEALNSSRFVYGLTKDGQYFFPNNSSFSKGFNIDIDDDILEDSYFSNIYGIEESKNLLVSPKDDSIKKINIYLVLMHLIL